MNLVFMFLLLKMLILSSSWHIGIINVIVARSSWRILHNSWWFKLTWVMGQRACEKSSFSLLLCSCWLVGTSLWSEKLLECMAKFVLVVSHCSFQIVLETTISFLFPQGPKTIGSSLRYSVFALYFLPESRATTLCRVCAPKFENLDALSDIKPRPCGMEVDSKTVDLLIDIFKITIIA